MKTKSKQFMGFFLLVLFFIGGTPLVAQEDYREPETNEEFITVSGKIRDQRNRRAIEYANISIPGTSIGTISNVDGEFSIKVVKSLQATNIMVSHIGYMNSLIPINGRDLSDLTINMQPNSNLLEEIIVRAMNPRSVVMQAIDKISKNYSNESNLLTGFYRETAQKGRRYINISEAIIDIYKSPYKDMNVYRDRAQIYKGRKLLSQKKSDTLIVKLLGGPNLSIFGDIAKNPDILLDPQMMNYYNFKMEESVMLDDRLNYVIRFTPAVTLPYALYEGLLYIDREKLSFTRAEFNLDMSDKTKATEAILRKKPTGLRFNPQGVTFLVNYKDRDGVTYLSYIRNEVRFSCDWRRKLFATNYTVLSEMVVTDSKVADETIPYRMSFKANESLSDNVTHFYDEDFWGAYNIIEPTESLESAVGKLRKQLR